MYGQRIEEIECH